MNKPSPPYEDDSSIHLKNNNQVSKSIHFLALFLKYVFGISIVFWLFHTQQLNLTELNTLSLFTCGVALVLCAIQMILAAWRIQILLSDRDISVSFSRCLLYNCVGIFYCLVLPGGMSGDAIRAYYFLRCTQTQGCNKKALLSALVTDRLIGTVTMILIGILAASCIASQIGLSDVDLVLIWIGFFLGISVYQLFCRYHTLIRMKTSNSRLQSFMTHFKQLIQHLDLSNYSHQTLRLALFFSIFIHLIAALIIFLMATSLKSSLSLFHVMALSPIGLLMNAIPLSPGGLGIGEKGFAMLFSVMGENQGGNIFMLSRLFLFAPAIVGAAYCYLNWLRKYVQLKR